MTSSLFSDQEKTLIAESVGAAEKKTSAEFVIATTDRSSRYAGFRAFAAVILTWSTTILLYWLLYQVHAIWFFLLQIPFGAFFWWLCGRRSILLPWVPDAEEQRLVKKKAEQLFLETGIHRAGHRAGILVLLSAFERRVQILADEAAFKELGSTRLTQLAMELALTWKTDSAASAVRTFLAKVSAELATSLPPGAHSSELSDQVLER